EYSRGVMRTQAVDKEKSRLSAGFQCIHFVDWRLAAALVLLGRVLSLAVRILLLLSGFLPTTLLLAGLLVRILILLARLLPWILILLLARILVCARPRDLPCLMPQGGQLGNPLWVAQELLFLKTLLKRLSPPPGRWLGFAKTISVQDLRLTAR